MIVINTILPGNRAKYIAGNIENIIENFINFSIFILKNVNN